MVVNFARVVANNFLQKIMSKIAEIYKQWCELQPFSANDKSRLSRKLMLDFNYNSNHIEGKMIIRQL